MPSCSACPPNQNSAVKLRSSLEALAELAARWHYCSRERALIFWWLTLTSRAPVKLLTKPVRLLLPNFSRTLGLTSVRLPPLRKRRILRYLNLAAWISSLTRPRSIPYPDDDGELADAQWAQTFLVNVTGNYFLARQTEWIFKDQGLPAAVVLTSSANAVVPKNGSEAYDTSKAALNHLIRELSIRLGPHVRVNGIAPATVVAGSTMFPRDRVMQSLEKYKIAFAQLDSTEELRAKLADFYAQRTVTKRPIFP